MRFELFIPALKKRETRIHATLIEGNKVSTYYKVETSLGPNHTTTLEKAAQPKSADSAETKLIKHAYKLFCTQFPQWNNAVKHLTLRFDVVH